MTIIQAAALALALLLAGLQPAAASPADARLRLDVQEFRLSNGMLLLVVDRPATPQVAARLAIRAGSALEESGKTGIAHMLEHMLFKGTRNFGTTDPARDEELQRRIDAAYAAVRSEQARRDPDAELIRRKLAEMEALRLEAQKLYLPQLFSTQLGRNGAVGVNAFTSADQTQYLAAVPADMLEQWFSIVSEQVFEPAWREFYVEKEVVQREWAFRYVNNPEGAAWLDLNAAAYTAHPYRNPVIGWKSDMERYHTDDARAFHARHYHPANAVCVLVGDVRPAEALRLAEIYFGRYPAGERAPETVTAEPPQQGPRRSVRFLAGARTPAVRLGFHGAAMNTADFFALDALAMVLSQGRSARLQRNLVDQGLAASAWAANPDNRYGGLVVLGGSPNEPEALKSSGLTEEERRRAYLSACEALEQRLLAEVETLKQEPVSRAELARMLKLNERDFIDRLRSNESVAGTLATLEVQVGWRYLNDYLARMAAVTPEEIQRVARRVFRPENQTTVFVLPGGPSEQPPESYSEVRSLGSGAARDWERPPGDWRNLSRYPTPPGWKHPLSFERRPQRIRYPQAEELAIGPAPVYFLPDPELPIVDLAIFVKAGAVDLAESQAGLAELLEETIVRGGTAAHPPAELARILDDNAIRLSVEIGEEESAVRLSVLSADWERGLALLEEVLSRPRFDDQALAVAKEQALAALSRSGERAAEVARRESLIWHFQGHPYGRDPLAALAVIPTLGREDLARFLRTFFVPENMVMAVAGDIDRESVRAGLARLAAALPAAAAPVRRLAEPAGTPPVLTLIHKPGQVQSQVRILLPGLTRRHPDFWKSSLLMSIFGGSDSLLYTRLRDDLGIVYSAGFGQAFKWHAGLLVGAIACRGDQAAAAVAETLAIMASLTREIPARELELKRLDALNSFVFNLDSKSDLVQAYGRYRLRGEPLDTLTRIQDAFFDARAAELREIAGRLFDPGRIQVHVVADKTIPVSRVGGEAVSLEQELREFARKAGLPYREIPLR